MTYNVRKYNEIFPDDGKMLMNTKTQLITTYVCEPMDDEGYTMDWVEIELPEPEKVEI